MTSAQRRTLARRRERIAAIPRDATLRDTDGTVVALDTNPNRGKRNAARMEQLGTPVTIGTDGVAREGAARRVYSPLTVYTPRRTEKGHPISERVGRTHAKYTV